MTEQVNHPEHYNALGASCSECGHNIECIDVIANMDLPIGTAVKYLWRAGYKPEEGKEPIDKEIEDLEKAIWYIEYRIKQLKKKKASYILREIANTVERVSGAWKSISSGQHQTQNEISPLSPEEVIHQIKTTPTLSNY